MKINPKASPVCRRIAGKLASMTCAEFGAFQSFCLSAPGLTRDPASYERTIDEFNTKRAAGRRQEKPTMKNKPKPFSQWSPAQKKAAIDREIRLAKVANAKSEAFAMSVGLTPATTPAERYGLERAQLRQRHENETARNRDNVANAAPRYNMTPEDFEREVEAAARSYLAEIKAQATGREGKGLGTPDSPAKPMAKDSAGRVAKGPAASPGLPGKAGFGGKTGEAASLSAHMRKGEGMSDHPLHKGMADTLRLMGR